MEQNFSFSELYDVKLKATYPIEIKGKKYEIGEVITTFDRIQIANLNEIKTYTSAHGGFDDRDKVIWENVRQIDFTFSQGVFSKLQLAMLGNSRLLEKQKEEEILISKREELEIDENGIVELKEKPSCCLFVYNKETGERINQFDIIGEKGKTLVFNGLKYVDIIVDYDYKYLNGGTKMILGRRLIPGYLFMEGKTKVKEDGTGKVKTGIIKIPRLKIMSDLSIRLGNNANPVIANFRASGFPIGDKGTKTVMEMTVLNDDIDSDF